MPIKENFSTIPKLHKIILWDDMACTLFNFKENNGYNIKAWKTGVKRSLCINTDLAVLWLNN